MPDATNTAPANSEQQTATGSTGDGSSTPPPPAAPATPTDGEALKEAGRKALDDERKARRDAERALKEANARLEAAETAKLSDTERAVKEAAANARREALAEANARLVKAEAKAAAVGKLANPELAAKLLDLDEFAPDDDGSIDGERIAKALDELVAKYPELAASSAAAPAAAPAAKPPTGTMPTGARGDSQVTFSRSQLRDPAFYQANKDAILKAAREGRITND